VNIAGDTLALADDSTDGHRALADTVAKRKFEHGIDSTLATKPSDNVAMRFLKQRSRVRMHDVAQNQQSVLEAGLESFRHRLPDAIFLLVPVVAGILYLLYYRSGRYYAEHLVFALHVQSFAFIALSAMLLPSPWIVPLVLIWLAVYLFISMRAVYGEGRARTGAKFVVLTFSYSVALAAAMAILAVIVFLFG